LFAVKDFNVPTNRSKFSSVFDAPAAFLIGGNASSSGGITVVSSAALIANDAKSVPKRIVLRFFLIMVPPQNKGASQNSSR